MLLMCFSTALRGEVAATHGAIREPITTAMFGHDQVLVVSVPLAGSGTDATSDHALATLRTQALPATFGKVLHRLRRDHALAAAVHVRAAVRASMDYHVFILSRIRELRLGGASARTAVTDGIARSAGVVTSAAAVMVAVFSIFATLSMVEFKMFGMAMATAVLIDATIVRGVLLPTGLALIGDRAWPRPGVQPQVLTGKPRLTPPWLGSSQRDVTTLPRV